MPDTPRPPGTPPAGGAPSGRPRPPHGARGPRPARFQQEPDEPAERLADLLSQFLKKSGMESRIKQSAVLEQWANLVGPEIGAATRALSISDDGTLFVAVRSNAWMSELSMMERELLASVNRVTGDKPILHLRWQLMR